MDKLLFKVKNLNSIVKEIYNQIDLVQHDIILLGRLRDKSALGSWRYRCLSFKIEVLGKYRQFLFEMIKNYNCMEVK